MKELKTLEDFADNDSLRRLRNRVIKQHNIFENSKEYTHCLPCLDQVQIDLLNKLQAEAIKDYKAIKNKELVIDVLTYIRVKNNLTEENLEEEE